MWVISTLVMLVSLPYVFCDENAISCKTLALQVEEETTKGIKATLEAMVKDTQKLVLLTHDFIEPLEIVDIIPFEDKLRNQANPYIFNTSTSYTETVEMEKLRKIMYENLDREDPDRPLTWYAVGLEPKDGNTMGGYFGYGSDESGSYYLDSTVHTSASDNGNWSKYPDFGNCLRWMRWPLSYSGSPDYSGAIDWGFWEPTVRPWYESGKKGEEGSVLFLDPYKFSTGGGTGIGIGTVAPLHKNGVFKGVIDAEYDITFLSDYLRAQREAIDGVVYIYDAASKSIVAISTDELVDGEGELWKADTNHPNALVQQSIGAVTNKDDAFGDYYVYSDTFKSTQYGVEGIDWVIVTVWSNIHCFDPCKLLAYEVEEETTQGIKNTLEAIVLDTEKLVLLTHDFIEPLEIADIIPFEDKLRNQANPYIFNTSTSYTETAEMDVLRKIMYENLLREDEDRPLTWYAVGLEPKDGNTMGGYFGYGTDDSGSYYLDSTVHTSASDKGNWSDYPDFGNCLRWMRWPLQSGSPDYSGAIDWGFWEPTVRPWYESGKKGGEGKVLFLEPYEFNTGGGAGIGIGTVAPLHKNGVFKGVIDAEYDISFLSRSYLSAQRESIDGVIYIYDQNTKKVVAISTIYEESLVDGDGALWEADKHPNELVKKSMELITFKNTVWPVKKSFGDNEQYYVYADEFKSSPFDVNGIDWVVVTVWSRVYHLDAKHTLMFEVEEETTNGIKATLEAMVKDTEKLVLLTHDLIEPLEIADIIPFEDKLRNQANPYIFNTSTSYTETAEMDVIRKIMYENLLREDEDRPLTWYAVGLEPKDGNTMGGYFGYGTDDSGSYYLDSTVHTSASDNGIWNKYPDFGNCLRWMRWPLQSGSPDYSGAIDWGFWEPTVRPWYISGKAVLEGSVAFLEPYQFATGGVNGIGIGMVAPLHKNGVFKGVIDAEYDISFLSKHLALQFESADGVIYIYDRVGKTIVAISTNQLVDGDSLLKANENHPNGLVRESIKLISSNYIIFPARKNVFEYYVYADEFVMGTIDWVIVTVWCPFPPCSLSKAPTDAPTTAPAAPTTSNATVDAPTTVSSADSNYSFFSFQLILFSIFFPFLQ